MTQLGHLFACTLVVSVCGSDADGKGASIQKGKQAHMDSVEIKPGKSIGQLQLGSSRGALPGKAALTGSVGELDGIAFLLENERVVDVWIDDLRKFTRELRYGARAIARDATLEQLKSIFGPCERVDVKGGVFYNCAVGVTLGTDFEEKGRFVQIRLRPRAAGLDR